MVMTSVVKVTAAAAAAAAAAAVVLVVAPRARNYWPCLSR